MGPVQVTGEVLNLRRVGAYWLLSLVAPGIAERARPGQFVALAVGGPDTALLLRRAVVGKGTEWLSRLRRHDVVNVVGPLGRPFRLPAEPVSAVLVGGGYGTASLFGLGQALRDRQCRVEYIIGAGTADRLFGVLDAKRMAVRLTVTTEDGSVGERGRVTDVLPDVIERSDAALVYACGPMPMLRAVAHIADSHGLPCQVAVEESMACGIGVCMTCVLPVVGPDGVTRMLRACIEGPTFLAEHLRFDAIGTVPVGALRASESVGGGT
jgi:dihydroorotate dehydrogenase electron transfer subunit